MRLGKVACTTRAVTVARSQVWVLLSSIVFSACALGEATDVDDLKPGDGGADVHAPKSDAAAPKDSSTNTVDAGLDATPNPGDASADANDASTDASDAQVTKDAANDAPVVVDAAKDSAPDAPPKDAAKDVVVDAPPDSSVDAGSDASVDAMIDAPADAPVVDAPITDSGTDGGASGLTCPNGACLLISEVYEGASNDKALEIYNACTANVDLTSVDVCIEFNSSSYCKNGTGTGNTIALTGMLKPRETFVLCHSSISSSGSCDKLDVKLAFNGNDRIALLRNNSIVDAFGELGKDPGDLWAEQDYRRTTCGAYLGTGTFSTSSYVSQASSSFADLGKGP